ncbi:MAG: HAD family hydrolase [Anaerolineales bacterium]|nr:HAD family hydrolase [Anaerolineales bacterium]
MNLQAVIFDLDGTLVDSAPGIEAALRQAMLQFHPGEDGMLADLRQRIGPPVGEIIRSLLPGASPAEADAIEAAYRGIYDSNAWRLTRLYPGARQALEWLREVGLACYLVTYKPALPTRGILHALDLAACFREVLTPDSRQPPFASKAEMLDHLLNEHDLKPAHAILVGDTGDDALAAQECGLAFVAAAYGYGDLPQAAPTPPLGVLAGPGELPRILAGGSLDE